MFLVTVIKRPRIDNQLACLLIWPLEVNFVGFDLRYS